MQSIFSVITRKLIHFEKNYFLFLSFRSSYTENFYDNDSNIFKTYELTQVQVHFQVRIKTLTRFSLDGEYNFFFN